jgi:hypothetical protein
MDPLPDSIPAKDFDTLNRRTVVPLETYVNLKMTFELIEVSMFSKSLIGRTEVKKDAAALSIMTLSIKTLSIMTLSIMTPSIMTLSIMTISIMTLNTVLENATLNIIIFAIKPFRLNVVAPS